MTGILAFLAVIFPVIFIFLVVISIMYLILPFWVFRIRNELIETNLRLNMIVEKIAPQKGAEAHPLIDIYYEPRPESSIKFTAPDSWKIEFGPAENGWRTAKIIADAPVSCLNQTGYVKESDLHVP